MVWNLASTLASSMPMQPAAARTIDGALPARESDRLAGLLASAGTVGAIALLLMLPALWNGAPLFYYDSVDYLRMPFTFEVPVFRTAPYGVFAGIGRLFGSLWAIVAVQALMVAYVAWLSARIFAPRVPPLGVVALVGLVCAVSGLPWFTSQVMADAFSGAVILGVATLALGGRRLGKLHTFLLLVAVAVGIAVHTSHLGVTGGLVIVLAALRLLRRWIPDLPEIRLLPPVGTIALAVALAVASNWAMTNRAFLVQPTDNLTLALFVENGLAKRYLDEVCPKRRNAFRLCAYRDRLPQTANAFLWGYFGRSPFEKLGGWKSKAMSEEAEDIVEGSVDAYPLDFAWLSLVFTARQFAMIETGDGLVPMNWHIEDAIRRFYPRQLPAFRAAEQQEGLNFDLLNPIEVTVYFVGVLLLPAAFWMAWRRGARAAGLLPVLVLLALLGNAFICGALSNPNHRYQGRLAWLPLFAVTLAILPFGSRGRRG